MKITKSNKAFTLIELLVVISIIAILAGIALPAFTTVQVKGKQTKEISNVKQIMLALRLYASDNDGNYPSSQPGVSPAQDVATSNAAFQQLFPQYLQNETIFWTSNAGYGTKAPDNRIDTPAPAAGTAYQYTLVANECTYAYVRNLSDTSNSSFPVVADNFADVSQHTYATEENAKGGVWKGLKAIVAFADASAQLLPVDQTTHTILKSPQGKDLFNTTETNWLSPGTGSAGTAQTAVNPL